MSRTTTLGWTVKKPARPILTVSLMTLTSEHQPAIYTLMLNRSKPLKLALIITGRIRSVRLVKVGLSVSTVISRYLSSCLTIIFSSYAVIWCFLFYVHLEVCSYEAFGKSIPADSYTKVSVTGILSLTECVAACNQDATCIGLIFNTNFNDGCFKYLSTNNIAPFTDLQNLQLVNDGRVGYKRLTCGDASTVPPTDPPGSK